MKLAKRKGLLEMGYKCNTVLYVLKNEKHFKNEEKVGMLLQKRTDTRGVGISSMRKSIYLLTTTPSSHTHRFHPLPLATPASLLTAPTSHTHTFHPLPLATPV